MIENNEELLQIRQEDLEINPASRLAVGLCLDVSFSMSEVKGGTPTGETVYKDGTQYNIVKGGGPTRLAKMVEGLENFYKSLREDETAYYAAEPAIITFNDTAQCVQDFCNLEHQEELPKFKAAGETALGEGVNLTLDLLEKRKQEYKDAGVNYYQPWLVIMTDGYPNGSEEELERAIERIQKLTAEKKLSVFAIGVGDEVDMEVLNRLSPARAAVMLQGLNFKEFFEWLSKSVSDVSKSQKGEDIALDVEGMQGWASVKA